LARRARHTDPLNSVQQITPAVLVGIGVTERRQQAEIFVDYRNWIRNMFLGREYSVALKARREVLASDWEDLDQAQIADLRLSVARLYWKQKKLFSCFVAACQAVIAKPVVARDLLGALLRRIGLA
jgi:hypothetical protein